MSTRQRLVLAALLAAGLTASPLLAADADTYPDRLIKIVVPQAAGGPTAERVKWEALAHSAGIRID